MQPPSPHASTPRTAIRRGHAQGSHPGKIARQPPDLAQRQEQREREQPELDAHRRAAAHPL